MIVVKRIAGESYDLTSGESQAKALVLSNGSNEVFVPVTDETAMRVIQLMLLSHKAPDAKIGAPANLEPPSPAETLLQIAPEPVEVDASDFDEYADSETGTASI